MPTYRYLSSSVAALALGVSAFATGCDDGEQLQAHDKGEFELAPAGPGAHEALRLHIATPGDEPELRFQFGCHGAGWADLTMALQDAEGRPLERTNFSLGGRNRPEGDADVAPDDNPDDAEPDVHVGFYGHWQLTGEQRDAYCRRDGGDYRACEVDVRAVLSLRPPLFEGESPVALRCSWGLYVSNRVDRNSPDAPRIARSP